MGDSHYVERPPSAELTGFVECVWCQRIEPGGGPHRQRVLPDGCVDALWIGGELRIAGPDTRWSLADAPPGAVTVGVRFAPGAARLLCGAVPVNEVRDQRVDLADVWGARPAARLAAQVAGADSPAQVADLVQRAVVARLPEVDLDPVVRSAIHLLDLPRPGSLPVVAARFGLSERQLRRRFDTTVGYGPKTLAGVLRLRRAMNRFWSGTPNIADVAWSAGYADQAHLTREMRRLAGVTPGELG